MFVRETGSKYNLYDKPLIRCIKPNVSCTEFDYRKYVRFFFNYLVGTLQKRGL